MIISLAIQKGGSGKTTTAVNLGARLRDLGRKVLLIDMDPQANLSQSLGFIENHNPNISHLIRSFFRGEDAYISNAIYEANGMDLVPASHELGDAELELVSTYNREHLLKMLLEEVNDQYDNIIIDCPPSVGLLTINALSASNFVILPLQAEFLPLKGVESFMHRFNIVRKQLNPQIKVLGYLLTKFEPRKKMNQQIWERLHNEFGKTVFNTRIRSNITLAHAQENGQDIFSYDSRCNGAQDYENLTAEVLERINLEKQ